jgi:alpha-beta hydrolase superfamily lysophospholipase
MGACHEHWNKFLAELDTNRYTAYALDLLGFGDSDKPVPSLEAGPREHLYNFDTWSLQIQDFVDQVREVKKHGMVVWHWEGVCVCVWGGAAVPSCSLCPLG